jgi:hypothetical protein
MAVTANIYGAFPGSLAQKLIDLDSDAIKVMLCTSSYTPDLDAHDFKNDVTSEVTGTGYTAGGATLGSVTLTYDAPTNTWKFDAADVTWAASTITARYAVIYDSTPGTDATRPLIAIIDFGANVSSTAADFTIQWAAGGIATFLAV